MYGKGAGTGTATTVTGVTLLPETGDNRVLFAVATGLVLTGIVVLAITLVMARKARGAAN